MNKASNKHTLAQDPIQKNTVVGQIMERVKDLIASGVYKPGDRLPTEQELSEMFQVGRSSIREALKVFQYLGVVESKAAKGTFIQERANISLEAITWALVLGKDDMEDVYELRKAIEYISIRKFLTNLQIKTPEAIQSLDDLRNIVREMYEIVETDDREQMVLADFSFHKIIIKAGENKLFIDMYNTLNSFLKNEIKLTYDIIGNLNTVADDHNQILKSIETQPADRAMKRHWEHFERTQALLGLQVFPTSHELPTVNLNSFTKQES